MIIPAPEQDKGLGTKLKAERSGILNWLIEGCLEWQRDGLTEPEEVLNATAAYRTEQDVIADFLGERCSTGKDRKVTATTLYSAYKTWCENAGEKPMTKTKLGIRLSDHGFTKERGTGGERYWSGVGLATQNGGTGQ